MIIEKMKSLHNKNPEGWYLQFTEYLKPALQFTELELGTSQKKIRIRINEAATHRVLNPCVF